MADIEHQIQVLSPKAGDTIAVSLSGRLTPSQHEPMHEQLKAKLLEGVRTMILDGGMTLTHVESPEAAKERHELLCEIAALREDLRSAREAMAKQREAGADVHDIWSSR